MPILYCNCSFANIIPNERKSEIREFIASATTEVTEVADLCRLAVIDPQRMQEIAAGEPLTIIACHPHVVRTLFYRVQSRLTDAVKILDMRRADASEILAQLECYAGSRQTPPVIEDEKNDGWIPWYPLIDYDRCTGCQQCASFCLFGVYTVDEQGRVVVTNPRNCKTDCPACARICPQVAIIFPKHHEAPINGAEVDAALSGGLVQVDIAELLGDDPYQALLARQQENKVPLFKEQIKLAQQEQANCSQSQATSAGKKPCACSCERQIETAQQGQASCSQSQASSAGKKPCACSKNKQTVE